MADHSATRPPRAQGDGEGPVYVRSMSHSFDKGYWESHWRSSPGGSGAVAVAASPYVDTELAGLDPGTALDAGCGEGAEAIRLAARGWRVTGADISAEALAR